MFRYGWNDTYIQVREVVNGTSVELEHITNNTLGVSKFEVYKVHCTEDSMYILDRHSGGVFRFTGYDIVTKKFTGLKNFTIPNIKFWDFHVRN